MSVPGMDVRTTDDGIVVVTFEAPRIFDPPSIGAMGKALRQVARGHDVPRVVLDLSRVQGVVSAFLGEMIALHSEVQGRGGALRFCGVSPGVGEIFRLLKLDVLFSIDPDVATALLDIRTLGKSHP